MPTWPPPQPDPADPADLLPSGPPYPTYPRPTPRPLMPYDPSHAVAAARLPRLQALQRDPATGRHLPPRLCSDPAGPFASLTWQQQRTAEQLLYKFCARWGSDLPHWRRAILTGVAKRLALHPLGSDWGRATFRARGNKAAVRAAQIATALGQPTPLDKAQAARREKARERREGPRMMAKGWLPVD